VHDQSRDSRSIKVRPRIKICLILRGTFGLKDKVKMNVPQFNAPRNKQGHKFLFEKYLWEEFELGSQLGEDGQYGSVFKVIDRQSKQEYAMKKINVENEHSATDFEKIRKAVMEYQHHLRAITTITHQMDKHFLQVYDYALVGTKNGIQIFILMEKADGTLLDAARLFGGRLKY
jgi:serine/threonine protein kinase